MLRESHGSESVRRSDPAGGPEGYRHKGRVKLNFEL